MINDLNSEYESNFDHNQAAALEERDFEFQDLSELPLEDFADIESLLNDVIEDQDKLEDMPTQNLAIMDNNENFLGTFSEQSSPVDFTPFETNEYNNLLDTVFDSKFVQEFANVSNDTVNLMMHQS